jgi:hypothetical protein
MEDSPAASGDEARVDIVVRAGAAFTALDQNLPGHSYEYAITIQFIPGSADNLKVTVIEIH